MAELQRTFLPLAHGLSGSVTSLSDLRSDLSATLEKLVFALSGIQSRAASIDAAPRASGGGSGPMADAARFLDSASQAIENAARELSPAARVPRDTEGRGADNRCSDSPGPVTDAMLSSLDYRLGKGTRAAFAAIRSTLTEIYVVQNAVAWLARRVEPLAEDVAARRLASPPEPVQRHLPDLLAAIDRTIGRLHSAATAIAYATDCDPMHGAAYGPVP